MIHYVLYQNKRKTGKMAGKWYARAKVIDTVTLDQLAEHMARHNTPYSKGAIEGVLTDMVSCIAELIAEGNQVKIPNLAIFRASIHGLGAETAADYNPAKCVTGVSLSARPTGGFSTRTIEKMASVREMGGYSVDKKAAADAPGQ